MTTEINAAVRSTLEACVKGFNKVGAEQAKLNDKRTGNYTGVVAAAIEAGSLAALDAAYDSLKADISENIGNIGKRLGCGLSKPDKEGNSRYIVPSGMMSAVSVIRACFEYGISLTDEDGEARTFGDLRKAKSEADASAKAATMTPAQAAQAEVRALCAQIAENANALTVTEAQEVAKILASIVATERGEKASEKKAA